MKAVKRYEDQNGSEVWVEGEVLFQLWIFVVIRTTRIAYADRIEPLAPRWMLVTTSGIGWFPLEER